MGNFWSDFINKSGGEYNARFEFDKLCHTLLSYHYPGRKLINANKIDTLSDGENLILVYLPKFFFDELTNSRKSQIRKAFNHTLEVVKDKDVKIFKWILCTPYKLTEDELKWWNQWKYKNFDQHNVEIDLIDGEQILDLLKKYNITEPQKEKKQADQSPTIASPQDYDLEFEIDTDQTTTGTEETQPPVQDQQVEEVGEQQDEPADNQDNVAAAAEDTQGQPQEKQDKTTTDTQDQPAGEDKTGQEKTTQQAIKLENYYKIRDTYLKILSSLEKLHKEEKEHFKRLRIISDFDYQRFREQPDPDATKDQKVLDLYFKAKTHEVDRKYDLAYFYYELLNKRKDEVKSRLKNKAQEIEKSYKETERQLIFEQKILTGDLLLVKDKKLEALENYEDALRLKPKNPEAKIKYNELLGDMLMESGLYSEAKKAYTEALDKVSNRFKDKKTELQKKKRIASRMSISALKIPIVSPLILWFARMSEVHNDFKLINVKEIARLNRFLVISGIVIGVGVFAFLIGFNLKHTSTVAANSTIDTVKQAWDLKRSAIVKGDRYLGKFKKYGIQRIDLLDSARMSYQRALRYDRFDPYALKKYSYTKRLWENYIKIAQKRLKENPAKYYRAIKPMSEGLQLVKYIYDPAHPNLAKFGYIDQKHKLVIPPVYDFDYNRRMKPGRESFHQGHAYVCIVVRPGDTAYFQINRFGRRTSKIYWVGPKHYYTGKK